MNNIFIRAYTKVSVVFDKARTTIVQMRKSRFVSTARSRYTRVVRLSQPHIEKINERLDIALSKRMSLSDQTFLAKRLSFLTNAGIPLVESLSILHEQARGRGQKVMLNQIIRDTSGGQSLSRSFAKYPKIFSDFAVHIIRVGETSGTLSKNLEYLATELKKRHALRRKVIGAFVYPIIVSIATIGITAFLMVYLFPKIIPIFDSLHTKLPITTRIVIAVSNAVTEHGSTILLATFALVVVFVFSERRIRAFRYFVHRTILRMPLFGKMIRYYNVANGSRTLGILLKSGLKLSEALPIVAETTRNLAYREQFVVLGEAIYRGELISRHLRAHREYFPDIFGNLVAVGERSGSLSDTLIYLSELYESEVDDFTKNISTMLEPALMVFMGLLVGFIAISIITPIYGITQNLHG